jgi:hypothetical protein
MRGLGQRLQARLTYANVTATMALVVGLSGGAYAAATLPRDSVGAAQIKTGAVGPSELRTGAVRSRDVRNKSLEVRDLSVRARESLRGETGPAGPPGAAAVTFRAAVAAGGDPTAGNAVGVVHSAGSNQYSVRFSRPLAGCVPTATLATTSGEISASPSGDTVVVKTFSSAGAALAAGFNLTVAC